MQPEGVIEGVLKREDDGPLPPGLVVGAEPRGPSISVTKRHKGVVSKDGKFRIDGLPPVTFTLHFGEMPDGWTAGTRTDVLVAAGETTGGSDLSLERGAVVSGKVVDNVTAKAIAGAHVSAINPSGGGGIDCAKRDAHGAFSVRLPAGESHVYISGPPEKYTYLSNDHPDRNGVTVHITDVTDKTDVVLRLEPRESAGGL